MSLKHTFNSAKTDGGDATQVQPSNWNAEHVVDSSGLKMSAASTTPSSPATGYVQAVGVSWANRAVLGMLGETGLMKLAQAQLIRTPMMAWVPAPGGSLNVIGTSSTVTSTSRTPATTNMLTAASRIGLVSATSAGSGNNLRAGSSALKWYRGAGARLGGFFNVWRFGITDPVLVTDSRLFIGMGASNTSYGNANPNAMTDAIGIGHDSGDTTLSIYTNDASGSPTKTSLGANFPCNTVSTDWYELALFCPPGASANISYEVTRLNTGDVATGTITTDLPTQGTLLQPHIFRWNGATAAACAVDLGGMYIESDN